MKRAYTLPSISCCGAKKRHLGTQNNPKSLGLEKLPRWKKWKDYFEPIEIGGLPPISTWMSQSTFKDIIEHIPQQDIIFKIKTCQGPYGKIGHTLDSL